MDKPKTRGEINAFIQANQHLSQQELAEQCGLSRNAIQQRELRMRSRGEIKMRDPAVQKGNVTDVHTEAKWEQRVRVAEQEKKQAEQKYRALQDDVARLREARDNALEISQHRPKIFKIQKDRKRHGGCGTAVVLCSDWHVEEVVPSHKVNYLNEHNPDISKRRINRLFDLIVRFIRVDREQTRIDNLILWLGGDFFTSDAHDAPVDMPPMIAAMYAQDLIVSGMKFIREEEPNLKIHVVGSVGNHSRKNIAKPVNQALEQEFSIEWMMYHTIKSIFAGDANITFQLDNSYHTYVKVYDKVVRFNHGHLGYRYNKGQAGLHGPLFKAIREVWDLQIKADLSCSGHYHTYTPAGLARPYITNGSTIGASPYGIQFGYEPPVQAYFIIHDRYGVVEQRPLFVDE